MGYTPIDVNFDDNEQISELQGAELREETKRPVRQEKAKSQPAKKQTAKKAEPVSRAEAEEKRERRVTVRESAPVVKKEKKPRETPLAVSAVNGLRSIMSTRSNTRVRTVNNSRRKPIPISAIAMAFVCTALLMFMIVSYVQINEYTVEVSSLRSELGDMVERDKELSLEIEKKNDMLAFLNHFIERIDLLLIPQGAEILRFFFL